MKDTPEAIRNEQWSQIQRRLTSALLDTYNGFRIHGPCTTMECALRMGMSPFLVRPRTSDLVDLGLVALDGRKGREGVYRAIPLEDVRRKLHDQASTIPVQTSLF